MESSFGPNSLDEPSLLYKLQCKIKVFNTSNPLPNRGYNLVSCSSKYGLVFVGTPDRFLTVYHLKDLIDKDCEPQHITINLQETPTHIAVSCDQELLAVTGGKLLSIYNISYFQNPNPQSIDIPLNKTSTFVSGLQWNPIIADNLAMVFFDGSLLVANISTSPQVKMVQSKARCLCWSPKGKQLVTGNSDGTLTQYKPDLTPAKNIAAPNLFEGAAIEALAVYWISTFMFAVVFKNATDNSRPVVTVVTTPKGNPPHCLNYEDICYSMGTNRPWYYYLQAIPQWCLIMASSSNSMEIATLGSKKDGESWTQWCQSDEARPELPLTDKKIENFPIGISIDTSAIYQLPAGENSSLPPMPLLHVLSHNGLLTIFNVINLNKDAPQLCAPPQQLNLPAAAMSSVIPGEVPAVQPTPAQAPPPMQTKEQTAPIQMAQTTQGPLAPTPPQQPAAPPQYSASVINIPKPPSYTQPQIAQGYASVSVQGEQKQVSEIKPTPVAQPKAATAPTVPVEPKPQTPQQAQENAALKAEQERISEMKANQELKDMLVKEVNDFQKELYRFTVKTRETQAKLQRDIESMKTNSAGLSIDSDQLRKECSLEDMRGAIVQLKLELVRACAVIAEARTHAEAKDYNQWTQADPLTTKRVASVKKLAYYVHNQLEQAQKALDYKWNEALARDPHFNKPGQRMIRPILDDVYQPLVKQQEILSRQQAVLRTLRNTLKECDVTPMFKSTSLLRNTPFKNKDPLSKLTKNILNMSIEPETTKEPLLSSQKLDALRDMLSNHKTIKIKPVNVEMRQHLANMKLNYAKSLKEKSQAVSVSPSEVKPQLNPVAVKAEVGVLPNVQVKIEPKREPISTPKDTPSFTPVGPMKPPVPGLTNVARTLFTDGPKPDPSVKAQLPQPTQPKQVVSAFVSQYSPVTPVTPLTPSSSSPANTGSVLKDVLQNKQVNFEPKAVEDKNDANMFMGQKICSPSSFTFSSTTISSAGTTATRTTAFAAKPTSDMFNIFNKFQPQSFVPESKPTSVQESISQTFEPKSQPSVPEAKPLSLVREPKPQIPVISNSKSSETGEPEAVETKTFTLKPKVDKPLTNMFGVKTPTSVLNSNVPDVLKTTQDVAKTETISKSVEKENLPEQAKAIQKPVAEKKDGAKNLTIQINKTSTFGAVPEAPSGGSSSQSSTESTPTETKAEPKIETEKAKSVAPATPASSASSIFAAANVTIPSEPKLSLTISSKIEEVTSKPEPVTPTSTPVEATSSLKSSIFSPTISSSAASVFGAAVAAQAKNTSQASSIFAAAAASSSLAPSSVFESTSKGSIFGSSQTSVFAPTTHPTSITTTESSALNTQTSDSPTQETPSSTFGLAVTTSQTSSIFSSSMFPALTTTSSTTSVFGSSTTSVFASAITKASIFDATTTTPSVFSSTATTTQSSIFSSVGTTSTPSAFTPTTQSSVFGASTVTTTSSGFGTSGGSVFASAAATSNQATVFGGQSTTTQASSIFGTATATTQASVFGTQPSTTQASVFGTPPSTTQASVFGTPPPLTQASVFGTSPSTTQASVFGTPPPTTQPSVFGTPPPTNQVSVFGTPPPTTQASVFGTPPQTTQASVFGTPPPTTQASVFGTPPPTTQASVFGTPPPTTQASVFGTPPPTTQASVFGSAPAQTSVFGTSDSTTAQSTSLFGGAESNLFAAASISTTSAPSQSSGGSIFGGSSSGSVFGGTNTNVFGSKSTFGQPNPTAASIFGAGGATTFGQKPASNFWSGGSANTESGFGSSSGGFGQQSTTQASSIFGGTTGGSFSTPSSGQGFGTPQQGVFSTPQQQASTGPAFGGSTVFGGNQPAFGSSASFGSPSGGFGSSFGGGFNKSPTSGFGAPAAFGGGATFGGGAAFGSTSPGKVYGGGNPAPAFSSAQSNATFESLATQNTLTFGNLAQQSGPPQQQAPSFNTSPSFTGWRG